MPKVKVIQRSWMYVTHNSWWYIHVPNMVWLCQRGKKLWPLHKAISKTLQIWPSGQGKCGVRIMNVCNTLSHGDRDLCVKYDGPISKQTEVVGWIQRHLKKPIYLTLRSKVNIVLGSWMYVTYHPMWQI